MDAEENEEQRSRAASHDNGPPVPGGRNERFPAGSVFGSSMPPRNTGEGVETSLIHLEKEMEVEADRSRRRKWGPMQRCTGQIPSPRGDLLP